MTEPEARAATPDAPDWERLYTEEAERYARLSNVHAKCAPSPTEDPYGFGPGYERHQHGDGEWCWRKVAPSPDAPGLLAALDEFAPSLAPDYPRYARWLRAKEAIRAALAASGDAPKGSICKCGLAKSYHGPNPPILADHDYEPRYSASGDAPREGLDKRLAGLIAHWENQVRLTPGGNHGLEHAIREAQHILASESHPTKERTND